MLRRLCNSLAIFLVVFIIISLLADLYYLDRVAQKDGKGQISYSDFRVFWDAGYNLRHYIIKFWDRPRGYPTFRPFWFLDPKLRNEEIHTAKPQQYPVYNKDKAFYHFRYSPFVAFAMMPIGKIYPPANALFVWHIILNIVYLILLLLMIRRLNVDLGVPAGSYKYLVLCGTFLMSLRFYLINIFLGQTDIWIAFLFALFLAAYIRNKDILCGVLLALILQLKPFFLTILIYFLFIGRIRIILSTIIGFVCFLFIPSYMLGLEKVIVLTREWFEILAISIPSQILNSKNHSFIYLLGNLLLNFRIIKNVFSQPHHLFYLISVSVTSFVYIALALARKIEEKVDRRRFAYLEVSILIIASLVFSPIAWEAYFINLVIPLAVAIYFTLNSVERKIPYAAISLFFLLSCVIGTDLTKFLPVVNSLPFNTISLGAAFLAFALLYSYKSYSPDAHH